MAKIKRFVKYIGPFANDADYVYFNSKRFYTVLKDGTKRPCNYTKEQCLSAINTGFWKESGPVVRHKYKYYKGPINPNKIYLFVEPGYIWFADGKTIIKHRWYKGYTLKTKAELDEECYVGPGKFIVELP